MSEFTTQLKTMAARCIYPALDWLVRFRKHLNALHLRDAMRAASCNSGISEMIEFRLRGSGNPVFLRRGTSDFAVFQKIFGEKEYQLPFAIKPRLIVDAGANIGLASLYFALEFPEAHIIALEPEASNMEVLRRNVISCPNIQPLEKALWNQETHLQIQNANAQPWAYQYDEGKGDGVETVTISSLLAFLETDFIDILKIDVEGAEQAILDGSAERWLDRVRLLIIELHDQYRPNSTRRLVERLASRNFQSLLFGESLFVYFTAEAEQAPWNLTSNRHG